MKLRLRIALATLAITAPMVFGLVWLDVRAQQDAAEAELAELVYARTELPGELERCRLDPSGWNQAPRLPPPPPPLAANEGDARARPGPRGPHRAPARFFIYDEKLTPRTPGAPALEADPSKLDWVTSRSSRLQADRVEVLVRTPWEDPVCAFILARGTTEPWLGAILPPTRIWALPALIVFVTVLFSIGPIVTRIRKLTAAVQRSAALHYAEELPEARSGGSDELAELARAFDRAGSQVRTLLQERDQRERALREFIADTTHDVAIPLTVLQGHLTTLREGLDAGTSVDRAALASAMDEAHYIGALMHNLGAAAKLDASELTLQRSAVELGALVMRVLGRHRPIAQQHGVAIDAAVPDHAVYAQADLTLLEQAVSNVVYNAVRHNRAGGHVAIVLHASGDDHFCIQVLDDGPGVPPELLTRLTERGFRSDRARTRSPEGQGLGLQISQRVLDAHGMQLRMRAAEGGGLQVEIEGARVSG